MLRRSFVLSLYHYYRSNTNLKHSNQLELIRALVFFYYSLTVSSLWKQHKQQKNLFDGSEDGQERCLSRQEFQLDWVQRLKGAPLKSSQDDREVPRGHKGWHEGVHPPGTLQEPHDEIMLSQGPAVHCIVVGRNSGHIHFKVEGDSLCLEPRGCLPVAFSAPARAGGICCDNSMPGHLF